MTSFNPKEFDAWFKETNTKKGDFAKRIGVSPTTISRWISGEKQPSAVKRALIKKIMAGEDSEPPTCTIPVRLTDELHAVALRIASRRGMEVDEWISECLQLFADEIAAVFMERHNIASLPKQSESAEEEK